MTDKIEIDCLNQSKISNTTSKIEREYNEYIDKKILWIKIKNFKEKLKKSWQ